MPSQPIVTTAIQDVVADNQAEDLNLNLLNFFDDPFTTGLVAQFALYNTTLGNGGITNVVLYDQTGAGAPRSVQNFLNYVEDGDYVDSIIHRSVPGFVIQGGGFVVDGIAENLGNLSNAVSSVPTDAEIQNEFSSERSNTRGTLAYAKGEGPDTATSQWFFNLSDNNASNLDNRNGGFTVFGEVLSQADLIPVDAIAVLPRLSAGGAFTDLPIVAQTATGFQFSSDNDFVRYRSITVEQQDELTFEVIGNSNPGLVTTTFNGNNQLVLDYVNGQTGTTNLTVRATNLQGQTVEDSFAVTVLADRSPGDLNRDAQQDLLWVNQSTGTLAFWSVTNLTGGANAVERGFVSTSSDLTGFEVVELIDYDQDGDSDILTRNYATSENRVLLMDGTQQVGEVLVGENLRIQNQAWRLQAAGNFDQDSAVEMLWRNNVTGGFAFWDLTGETAQASFFDLSVLGREQGILENLDWQIKAVADFDNDGKDEVVWRNVETGQNALWTLNGNVLESSVFLPELSSTEWDIVDAADYDQDGMVDLAWRNASTGQNVIWKLEQQGDSYARVDGFFLPELNSASWSIV